MKSWESTSPCLAVMKRCSGAPCGCHRGVPRKDWWPMAPARGATTSLRSLEAGLLEVWLLLTGLADHDGQAALDIRLRRGPRGNADAHGGASLPDRWPAPASTILLNGLDHAACLRLIAE